MGFGTRKCVGHSKEVKECEFIDSCDLCRVVTNVDNDEVYILGIGSPSFKCKRDNPNFKPMTKEEFLKLGMFIQEGNLKFDDLMNYAIEMGLVVDK